MILLRQAVRLEARCRSLFKALTYVVWNAFGVKVPGRKEAGYVRIHLKRLHPRCWFLPCFHVCCCVVLKYSTQSDWVGGWVRFICLTIPGDNSLLRGSRGRNFSSHQHLQSRVERNEHLEAASLDSSYPTLLNMPCLGDGVAHNEWARSLALTIKTILHGHAYRLT